MLVDLEERYSLIRKVCLALLFDTEKLRHYHQHRHTRVISKTDSLKHILYVPILNERLAKWAVLLQQYDTEYMSQKAIKSQALVDFLAAHPASDDSPLAIDLSDNSWL